MACSYNEALSTVNLNPLKVSVYNLRIPEKDRKTAPLGVARLKYYQSDSTINNDFD
jgi:hypothetical protein